MTAPTHHHPPRALCTVCGKWLFEYRNGVPGRTRNGVKPLGVSEVFMQAGPVAWHSFRCPTPCGTISYFKQSLR